MSETYTPDQSIYMPPAFAGMLADIQFTSKETHPCGTNPVPFGVVVTPASDGKVQAGGTGVGGGVAIHDHTVNGIYRSEQYRRYDAVSVIRRGRIWCRVTAAGTCTKGAVVKFNATTGEVSDAGANTLKNARFRTAQITANSNLPGEANQLLVLVELHDPAVDDVGAS